MEDLPHASILCTPDLVIESIPHLKIVLFASDRCPEMLQSGGGRLHVHLPRSSLVIRVSKLSIEFFIANDHQGYVSITQLPVIACRSNHKNQCLWLPLQGNWDTRLTP